MVPYKGHRCIAIGACAQTRPWGLKQIGPVKAMAVVAFVVVVVVVAVVATVVVAVAAIRVSQGAQGGMPHRFC